MSRLWVHRRKASAGMNEVLFGLKGHFFVSFYYRRRP